MQAFRQACNIEYIVFPSTLRTIGAEAFHNVAGSQIAWNEGLEEIGDRAFMYNRGADALVLPESLRAIGESPATADAASSSTKSRAAKP